MRLPVLLIPLIALVGCSNNTDRAATPAAPATGSTTTTTAGVAATPAAVAPAAVAPAKPAPAKAIVDLRGFAGPTDNPDLFGYQEDNGRLFLYAGGAITLQVRLSGDGDYHIVIRAACDEANGEKAKFLVSVDGQTVGNEVTCTTTDVNEYVVKVPGLSAGEHKIAIEFTNDAYKENEYDLNLYVHGVTLEPAK